MNSNYKEVFTAQKKLKDCGNVQEICAFWGSSKKVYSLTQYGILIFAG